MHIVAAERTHTDILLAMGRAYTEQAAAATALGCVCATHTQASATSMHNYTNTHALSVRVVALNTLNTHMHMLPAQQQQRLWQHTRRGSTITVLSSKPREGGVGGSCNKMCVISPHLRLNRRTNTFTHA